MSRKRSDAARRGWQTRRLREQRRERERQREYRRRSEAARKGWETRRTLEREKREEWKFPPGEDWIVEEPIDEVGGAIYP